MSLEEITALKDTLTASISHLEDEFNKEHTQTQLDTIEESIRLYESNLETIKTILQEK